MPMDLFMLFVHVMPVCVCVFIRIFSGDGSVRCFSCNASVCVHSVLHQLLTMFGFRYLKCDLLAPGSRQELFILAEHYLHSL